MRKWSQIMAVITAPVASIKKLYIVFMLRYIVWRYFLAICILNGMAVPPSANVSKMVLMENGRVYASPIMLILCFIIEGEYNTLHSPVIRSASKSYDNIKYVTLYESECRLNSLKILIVLGFLRMRLHHDQLPLFSCKGPERC